MSFATGLITGLAKSVDDQLKNDMLRTQKRMDGMEQYRVTRKRAEIERKQKETSELSDLLERFANSFTGGDLDKAEQLYLGAGGNLQDGLDYYKTLKENQAVSKNFSIEDHVTFSERVRGDKVKSNDIAKNYIKNARKYDDAETVKGVGLMSFFDQGKFGEQVSRRVESQVPTDTEDAFGKVQRKGAILNHSNMIDYKKWQKDNKPEAAATFEGEILRLYNELEFEDDVQKKKNINDRIKKVEGLIVEEANRKKKATGDSRYFSKEGVTKVFKENYMLNVDRKYLGGTGLGESLSFAMQGNEVPVLVGKKRALVGLNTAYGQRMSDPEFANKFSAEVAIYNSQKTDYIKKVMLDQKRPEDKKLTKSNYVMEVNKETFEQNVNQGKYNVGDVVVYKDDNNKSVNRIITSSGYL